MSQAGITNQALMTPYIVGTSNSTYATIGAAIAAAVSAGASISTPKTIYVQPGIYNENITLASGIIIVGDDSVSTKGVAFQATATAQVQSVKLTGSITLNTSLIAATTYASVQNIWISPATGNAVTATGNVAAGHDQLLYFKGCRIETNASNAYCFNLTNVEVTHEESFIYDNSIDKSGHYYICAGDSNTCFLSCINSAVWSDIGAAAAVQPANSVPSIIIQDSLYVASVDASNCTSYNFRCVNSIHGGLGFTNLTPYHVTGAATSGRIVYDNCTIAMNDAALNIATIGSFAFVIEFHNCNFGNIFGASGDTVVGGRQIFTNCAIQSNTNIYYTRNDLIKIGYSGASRYNYQAGLTTTDATISTLASVVVNEGETITLSGTLTGQKSDSTDSCGGNYLITARRAVAGNVTLVGAAVVNVNSTSTATFTADVDTATQTVRIRVTGIAATTYYWVGDYQYQKVLTSS